MALQFYFGPSGSGKSKKLHQDVLSMASKDPACNFLFLVPDQFTMQTQMDLVKESPNGGIMNIDVLSFGRLTHRIFEETGYGRKPVLDDTGKTRIFQNQPEAEAFLLCHGFTSEDLEYIYFVEVPENEE